MNLQQYYSKLPANNCKKLPLPVFLLILLSACSQFSPENFYRAARQMSLERNIIRSGVFPLAFYSKKLASSIPHLHLYLGGDGMPWQDLMTYAEDPSPRNPLVLELMQQDKTPSLFLGRPCYQGFANRPPCHYRYWTSARYSPLILDTLVIAIKNIVKKHQVNRLTLIGYSGGGTIAVLLANRIPETDTVVTIAGNLDTDAWTRHHGYSPLSESLNPAKQPALPSNIRQIHLQGNKDKNVPPELSTHFFQKQTRPYRLRFENTTHICCWKQKWPEILDKLHKKRFQAAKKQENTGTHEGFSIKFAPHRKELS